jgi:putative FmdB family regulatory protein
LRAIFEIGLGHAALRIERKQMPIYEYQCKECGDRHEIIQKLSDAPLSLCPKCGGEMKKLISSPAIQFKGSGFYKTDYAGSGSTSKSSDSKSETKTETKSESKSESKSSD